MKLIEKLQSTNKSQLLIYKAQAKNQRNILIVIVEKKQSKLKILIMKYLALQSPVVLPTVPWEQLEFLTKISEIIEIYGPRQIRTRAYCLRTFCPHPTAETLFRNLLKDKIT